MKVGKTNFIERYFGIRASGSNIRTEILAGLTTFFAMSYILFINPSVLAKAGMEWGAVFLATIIASVIGTLVMGLVANVPYAQAPGMGTGAFFTYTVCFGLGFTWQQALSIVFICGIINILITVTKARKMIIRSIPISLQNAIGGGIGLFVAYIGFLNVGFIDFSSGVPAIATFNTPVIWVFMIGLLLAIVLTLMNVKGALFIAIIVTTLIGIPFGVTNFGETVSLSEACQALPTTFLAIFRKGGILSLFTDVSKLPLTLVVIFAFSIMDTFDTIGTFIGTGVRAGIFNMEDELAAGDGKGFKTRFDKALFADATATSIGALIGTSNTTTFVESAAGIGVGGRTGFASVITSLCFILSAFLSTFVSAVPAAATAPVLVIVGIMMASSFKDINWSELDEAIPAFFTGIFMCLCYNISNGMAFGFITYCIVKICRKKIKEIHPIVWICTVLFILNFILFAFI